MGTLTRIAVNPLGDALAARKDDAKELGRMISDLELQLLELKAALEQEAEI